MSDLLQQAIAELSKLPETQQDMMAQWILDELADDMRWETAFSTSLAQLESLANKALADFDAGDTHTSL